MDDTICAGFWEHLAEEIEPLMQIGETLLNEALLSVEKYGIDLVTETDWEKLPDAFQDELRSHIISLVNNMPAFSLPVGLLQDGGLYQSIFENLEVQYDRLDKKDASARTFLLNLMEEVMNGSIASGAMRLSDWHKLLEKRKEASRVKNVGEYVYKKLCTALLPEQTMDIYDFFYNRTSDDEIDQLLNEARDSLLLALTHRRQTKKRGQGMSRVIIDYIHRWQDAGLMKPLKSVYHFCQCLQRYWNNEINLGTRQGLEATYKQRF